MAQWIDSQAQLETLAARLNAAPVLAIDTESNSYFAYRGRLCLLQISTADEDFLVDTLAGLDFSCMAEGFANDAQRKIIHDAEGDIPAIKAELGLTVRGLFDTRVAAGALGESKQGLASQLKKFLQLDIDKGQQLSDWGQRPLSAAQMTYAAGDTQHLIPLQQQMQAALASRSETVQLLFARECQRFEQLPARPIHVENPDAFFLNKGAAKLSPQALIFLRSLHRAREDCARRQDFPAPRLFPGKLLVQLAVRAGEKGPPQRIEQLASVGLSQAKLRRHGAWILQALQDALRAGDLDVAALRSSHFNAKMDMDAGERYLRLKAWRRDSAAALQVDASLLLLGESLKMLAIKAPRSLQELNTLLAHDSWFVAEFGELLLQRMWNA